MSAERNTRFAVCVVRVLNARGSRLTPRDGDRPRVGLQNVKEMVPADVKIQLIDKLAEVQQFARVCVWCCARSGVLTFARRWHSPWSDWSVGGGDDGLCLAQVGASDGRLARGAQGHQQGVGRLVSSACAECQGTTRTLYA